MRIIDLLNKIANDGEYPKIKFNNSIYEYHDKEHGYCRYYHDNTYICLNTDYYLFDILNDEVEIIEEPKGIPEKINNGYYHLEQGEQNQLFKNKINEIIDTLEMLNDKIK